MIVSAFVEVLLPILVVVACGYALRRVFPIDLRSLNHVSMYVLSPALIFTTLARIEVAGDEALRIAAASTLVIVLIGALKSGYPARGGRRSGTGVRQTEKYEALPRAASKV